MDAEGSGPRVAAVLGTLDTKAREVGFVAEQLRRAGIEPLVIDVGVKGSPGLKAQISREAVAEAAGHDLAELAAGKLAASDALQAMGNGAAVIVTRLAREGRIGGVIALGGGRGTAVTSTALRTLPFGFPKVLVSTAASGETGRLLGTKDIMIVSPVTDLLGVNRINSMVLTNASAAMAGMLRSRRGRRRAEPATPETGQTVGITCMGVTSPAVERCKSTLEAHGAEVLVFYARGPGGQAMEELIRAGTITAVIDLSLTELINEQVGGIAGAGPGRLEAAGQTGIPQVVLPGGIDVINFGSPETVPSTFSGRRFHRHSQSATLMRSDMAENARLGRTVAEKLNRSRGPVGVVIPEGGFSSYDVPGGPFWWPEADRAFVDGLAAFLRTDAHVEKLPEPINSEAVAQRAVELLLEMSSGKSRLMGLPNPAR